MTDMMSKLLRIGFKPSDEVKDVAMVEATNCNVWIVPIDDGIVRVTIFLPDGGVVRFYNHSSQFN